MISSGSTGTSGALAAAVVSESASVVWEVMLGFGPDACERVMLGDEGYTVRHFLSIYPLYLLRKSGLIVVAMCVKFAVKNVFSAFRTCRRRVHYVHVEEIPGKCKELGQKGKRTIRLV